MNKNILVLVEPEIPYNTGNIARSCVITGTPLHLVRPLGFQLTDHYIKRAGMDYWEDVDLTIWDSLEDFEEFMEDKAKEGYGVIYASTKGHQSLGDLHAQEPQVMLFGAESRGLPVDFMKKHPKRVYRIPMKSDQRSLNLSNSAAIVLYEVLRQQDYPGLV